MNLRLTRLLPIYLTTLLLLAAAGLGVQTAIAEEAPVEVLAESWSWISDNQGALAGTAASSAGDVNGDSYDDVIVGAPLYSTEIYRSGAAFLFYGSRPSLGKDPVWSVAGEVTGKEFGHAATGIGDVNCDGFDDVIVSAPLYGNNHGKVYVYQGSSRGLNLSAVWTYEGQVKDTYLGWSAAGAGNVNGDVNPANGISCDDVIIGAKGFSEGQMIEGAAFIFYGSPDGLTQIAPDLTLQENIVKAQFGFSVSGGGDLNCDGYDDVVVGAPFLSGIETSEGGIFVYYGSSLGIKADSGWSVRGGVAGAKFGWSVSGAGNVNGDLNPYNGRACDDLAAGAPTWKDLSGTVGAVFVFHGSSDGPSDEADWSHVNDEGEYIGYGEAISGAGEVNGDGFDDLIVGARYYSTNRDEMNGKIYVHHGGPSGLAQNPGWVAEGGKSDTAFGAWVASAGDVDLDGLTDIVVGAPEYKDASENKRGAAFVYHGFYQEVIDGVIVPIIRYSHFYLPVMIR